MLREPKDWKEGRRLRAWELATAGWKQCRIAEALGVSEGAVSQWLKEARKQGVAALYSRPVPGASKRLGVEQRAQLPSLLAKGATAFGFRGDFWTRQRVAQVIEREFAVTYAPRHVGRILAEMGWTRQKPVRRASQRDEERIHQWQAERWPALQKKLPTKDVPLSS